MQDRGESAALEQAFDQGIFFTDLVDLLVLEVDYFFEVVVFDEFDDAIGRYEVGLGNLEFGVEPTLPLRLVENRTSQQQPGRLTADAALVALGGDQMFEEIVEVPDTNVLLGDGDERQLVGKEPPDQCRSGSND